ncbi:MAG: glycerophosphodiester phosphodiesterase [Angelakisella sp.]
MATIFAHRGFSGRYPENTMLAFEKMLETGCAGTELDVQMTKDGELVIIHDETLERTTNGHGLVKDHTLAQLRELTADATYAGKVPPQKIPTLREYFTFIQDTGLITNIELKTSIFQYPGIEQATIDMVHEFGLEDRVWFSSFNHYTILRCKEICPTLSYGLLINCWIKDIGAYAQKLGATTVNAETEFLLEQEIVDDLHAHGIGAQAWTVNRPEQVKQLVETGVEYIITNFPDMAMAAIS